MPRTPGVLQRLETRGGRYAIQLLYDGDGSYTVESLTHGRSCGSSCGHTLQSAKIELERQVESAAIWDGINYREVSQ